MKRIFKQNAGLTLIELVVAIAMATIVTAAATSVLLMGLRINRQTGDTASQQITVRQLLTTVENILAEGNIQSYEADAESWRVISASDSVLLSYRYDTEQQSGTIYVGDCGDDTTEATGTPVLSGLVSSALVSHENNLVTVTVETKNGVYSSTVYCRMAGVAYNEIQMPKGMTGQKFFDSYVRSQGGSTGKIQTDDTTTDDITYYTEWYNSGSTEDQQNDHWCACMVSWALVQAGVPNTENAKWFDNVEKFKTYFQNGEGGSKWVAYGGDYIPQVGDLVFIEKNGTYHIGVVNRKLNANMIYCWWCHDNDSAGFGQGAHMSNAQNTFDILGYGVLPWAE